MKTKDIIDAIGKEAVKIEFDVTDKTIWAVGNSNKFPSKWFARMEELCLEKSITVPRALFSWKPEPKDNTA